MQLINFLRYSIPQFFHNSKVRAEILKLIKSASGSTTVTSSQISDASVIGKEILTATDADVIKADLGIPSDIPTQGDLDGKVDKVEGKQLSTEDYTTAEKTKLAGISTGATANQTDAYLLDRANHTGTQAISTIEGLEGRLDTIPDVVGGSETFTGDGTNTTMAIPHGFGDVPIGFSAVRSSGEVVTFTVNSDAENLTIEFDTAPTGNVGISWFVIG